jgi:hypothetical protein
MVPPKVGTFGTMGAESFRDTALKNVDFSVFKTFKFKEPYNATFRTEILQFVQSPIISNPYGASNGYGGASGGTNDMGNAQHVWLRVRHTRRGGRQSAGWFGKQPRDATRVEVHFLRTSASSRGVKSIPPRTLAIEPNRAEESPAHKGPGWACPESA